MPIEVLGPSGAGKSTILRAAERARAEPAPRVGPGEAAALIKELPGVRGREFVREALGRP